MINKLIIATLLYSTTATLALAAKLIPQVKPASSPSSTTAVSSSPAAPPAPPAPAARPVVAAPTPAPLQTSVSAAQPRGAALNPGIYAGAQLGDSTVGALLGYQINKTYAIEGSLDYVDAIYTPTTALQIYRAGITGLAFFPIKFNDLGPMSLYVKVGYGLTSSKFTLKDPGIPPLFPPTSIATTTVTTNVTAGAGVQLDLTSDTTARLGINFVGLDRSIYLAAFYRF